MRMIAIRNAAAPPNQDIARPHLDLSADVLREVFSGLVRGAEEQGGVEAYIAALKLKAEAFRNVFDEVTLDPRRFLELCAFMPTVRRRLAPYLEASAFARLEAALRELTDGMNDTGGADARMAGFCARFPQDRDHRFVRDLAAEVLHQLDPERYPLSTRWVWDAKANTGVLREIWFAEDVDHLTIPVDDDFATFLMLREELAQFLSANGVFRDMSHYVDMLCAQIYAQYICAQGGTYLRTDFAAPEDPMQHTRRMLGLDGVRPGRTRLTAIDA